MDNTIQIAERIKQLRKNLGLNQSEFCKKSQPYGLTTGSAGGLDEPLRGIFRYRL